MFFTLLRASWTRLSRRHSPRPPVSTPVSTSWASGFTLIELVIVIAIMGILSAIVMPNFNRVQTVAKDRALESIVNTIELGLASYHMVNGVYPDAESITGLLTELVASGDLAAMPLNPYTKAPFSDSDTKGALSYTVVEGDYSLTIDN